MILSPKLGLLVDFLLGGNGWKKPIEDSFRKLDAVVQLRATSIVNSPPSSTNGDCYIVGSAPTGVFASAGANSIATYYADQTQWLFIAPQQGWQATIGGQLMTFDGAGWTSLAGVVAAHPTFASLISSAVATATADKVSRSDAWIGNDAATGSGLLIKSYASSAHFNWKLSTQDTVGDGLEFARSQDPGGAIFLPKTFHLLQSQAVVSHYSIDPSGSNYLSFTHNNAAIGSITQSGTTGVSYNTTSDYRLKKNAKPLQGSGEFIDALQPKSWEWTRDGRVDAGFLAHEFQEVCPNAVNGVKDEMEAQQYEVEPAISATFDKEGNELTPAVPAVMAERIVPKYQSMQASSSEVIAHLVAELQSLRKRLAAAGIA